MLEESRPQGDNVQLRIVMDSLDPPCGRGDRDGEAPWSFTGWLELIERVETIGALREAAHGTDGGAR